MSRTTTVEERKPSLEADEVGATRPLVPLPDSGAPARPGRHVPRLRPALGLLVGMTGAAVVVAVSVLAVAGSFAPAPSGLVDPGLVVRVGLPAARAVHDLAAALTIGLLVLAVWAVAPGPGTPSEEMTGPRLAMLRAASVAAGAWLLSGVVVLTFTAAELAGQPLSTPGFGQTLRTFLSEVDLGRALGASAVAVAVVAVVTASSTRVAAAAWAAGCGLLALLPLALTGHAAGSGSHQNASTSLALHLVGVVLWVGGLGAVVLMARRLGTQLPVVVRRYSTLAGWCFAVVALSGVLSALLRLEPLSTAVSLYGLLALGKVVALALLGLAGWRHRVAVLPRLGGSGGRLAFVRLATVELLVMGAAMGLAVALSRSPAPGGAHGGGASAVPVPVLTAVRYLTQYSLDLLWLLVAGAGLAWYLWSAHLLSRRGEPWSARRTVSWTAGCLALVWTTSGGPAVYASVSFSAHLLQHLTLALLVPLLLVLGSPLTLALRSLPTREDGSLGARETLAMVLGSRIVGVLRDPVTATAILAGGLIAFYYLPGILELTLSTYGGQVVATVYLLAAGCLFGWVLLGSGSSGSRAAAPVQTRLAALALAGGLLVLFGITLQRSTVVLASRWWLGLGRLDLAGLLQDQRTGATMMVVVGAVLLLVAGLAVARGLRSTAATVPGAGVEVESETPFPTSSRRA